MTDVIDRPVQARLAAVASRVDQLQGEQSRLLDRLTEVRQELARAREERALVEQATKPARRAGIAEEVLRRTVRELGTFTVSELAAELGCSPGTAKRRLDSMLSATPPMAKPAGRVMGKPVYEWVRPTEAGAAFENQQRLGTRGPSESAVLAMADRVERGRPVAGVGDPSSVIAKKEVREVVRAALRDGWRLVPKGDGHWNLVSPQGASIGVAGTPKNPGGAADLIGRFVRNHSSEVAA
jgi:AraC-like DNA-binding protein